MQRSKLPESSINHSYMFHWWSGLLPSPCVKLPLYRYESIQSEDHTLPPRANDLSMVGCLLEIVCSFDKWPDALYDVVQTPAHFLIKNSLIVLVWTISFFWVKLFQLLACFKIALHLGHLVLECIEFSIDFIQTVSIYCSVSSGSRAAEHIANNNSRCCSCE